MSKINKIRLSGTDYDIQDVSATSVVEVTQQQYDDLPASAKTVNILYIITDSTVDYVTSAQTQSAITQAVSGKQDTLVSSVNIKTINNESLLGSGNIDIQGGGGGVPESAFTAYTASTNNRIAEDEEVTAAALNVINESLSGKQDTLSAGTNITIVDNVISATGGGGVTSGEVQTMIDNSISGKADTSYVDQSVSGKTNQNDFSAYTASTNSRIAEDEEVTAAALNTLSENFGGMKLVRLTQTEYDNLSTKDSNTLYVIVN